MRNCAELIEIMRIYAELCGIVWKLCGNYVELCSIYVRNYRIRAELSGIIGYVRYYADMCGIVQYYQKVCGHVQNFAGMWGIKEGVEQGFHLPSSLLC